MSYSATVYKIMIASPSDVMTERDIVREVVSEWNIIHSELRQIVLLPRGWETHSIPEMGEHPQILINKQVLQGSDLLIGVFWTRIGTATDNYDSGTVEEIEEHLKAGKPALLYFSTALILPDSMDTEQYSRLKNFRKSCQSRGLYESYSNPEEFRSKFSRQLQLKLNQEDFKNNSATDLATQPTVPKLELSEEAQILLKGCLSVSNGVIIHYQYPRRSIIKINGGSNLIKEHTQRERARWEEALNILDKNDLISVIRTEGERKEFKITQKGCEVADKIQEYKQI
jgi:hypothetical protein